jgi:hypothetical protein
MATIPQLTAAEKVETNFSIAIMNQPYGGLMFLPAFVGDGGPGQTGEFWKYDPRDFQKTGDVKRADNGTAYETMLVPTTDTYKTSERAKRTPLRDVTEMYADELAKPSRMATRRVVNELLLGHEKEVAAKLTSTSVMTQNVTLAGVTQLSDFTNSDPLDVFADMRLALKHVPYVVGQNGLLRAGMAPEVLEILRQHPDLQARFGNTDGLLSLANLAELMGVNEIVVLSSWKDTADDAASSATEARVWGKDIVVAYVNPSKEPETMAFGYTVFSRMPGTGGINPEFAMGAPIRVRDYREEQRGGGTTWREADAAWDLKVVLPTLGYLIKDAVA